jgi:hypothetical protein
MLFSMSIPTFSVGRGGIRAAQPLSHACGFKLANDGHDTRAIQAYSIMSTVRHKALTPNRFKNFWRD